MSVWSDSTGASAALAVMGHIDPLILAAGWLGLWLGFALATLALYSWLVITA
ncbi:hypothetical protein D3C84_1103070 [compost metagenome]